MVVCLEPAFDQRSPANSGDFFSRARRSRALCERPLQPNEGGEGDKLCDASAQRRKRKLASAARARDARALSLGSPVAPFARRER